MGDFLAEFGEFVVLAAFSAPIVYGMAAAGLKLVQAV